MLLRWALREVWGEDGLVGPWASGTSPPPQPSTKSVDLQGDSSLQVEISDAVSERDKVKFTVQTKVRDSSDEEPPPPASAPPGVWWADAIAAFGPCSSAWLLAPAPLRKWVFCLVSDRLC